MSTLAIPSGSRFRHAWHRRCRAAGLLLVCATAVSAQRFQFDYGKPSPAEVGTGIVQVAGGYVVAASNGADILGLGVDQTGTELVDACHAVFSGYGATLTPHCLRQTSDGGFIVAGEVIGNIAPSNQVFLAKFDKLGALIWPAVGPGKILCYHGDATGLRQGTRVVEMSGGGCGVITNVDVAGNSRGVLFTVAASGLLTCWDSYAYGNAPTLFHDLRENADGTFTIVGSVKDSTTGRRATLLLRTLPCGATPVWQNQYGFLPLMEDVEQQAITATKDGGFVVWGHYAPATSPFPGSFLLKVNGAGVPLWRQRFPQILGSRPTIVEAPNGDLLCNGRLGNDALVMRTDPAGVIKNVRTYGGAGGIVDEIFQVVITDDGGFAAVGSTQLVSASTNVYLLKGDAELHTGAACFELTPNINQSRDTPPHHPKVLQSVRGTGINYLYMTPPVPCLDPTELCYEPDCVKAPRNLDLWLPFDETSGTTAQNVLSMFGAPNGTQVNGPTPVPGKVAGALSFDGSNDHVVIPTHPGVDVTTGDFTIDAWIRVPAAGWTGVATIVDKRNLVGSATTGYSLFLFKNSSGAIQLGLQLADGTFANYLSGPLPIVAGQWHFVAVSVRRSGSSVFVLDATSYPFSHAHPLSLSNSSAVYVGRSSPALGGGSYFRGEIDELEVFRRALGPSELHTLWRASSMGKCKEGCSLPPKVKLCHDQNSVAATGWVANGTTVPRTYTCWFQGLPAGSGGTVGGPTVFTVNPTVVVSVPPMTRKSFSVTIGKPLDMTKLGQVGGFLMMVESSSGDTFTIHSALVDVWNYLCPHSWDPNQGGITMRVGTPSSLGPIRLTNGTSSAVSFQYRLVPVNDDGLEDTSVVSLNGLPPGSYPTGTALIPPLGTVDIDTTAEFVEYDGLGTYTVQLEADMDGDTVPDFLCGQVLNSYVGNGGPAVYIGVAAPTTVGTPRLAINRYPTIGDAGFQILANGLVPNGISALALAPALANPPLSLVLFGGQPNSILYCDPGSMQTVPLASGSVGSVALPVPLPNNPALIGATSYWQVFDVDVGLPYALPLGNSNAMSITIR